VSEFCKREGLGGRKQPITIRVRREKKNCICTNNLLEERERERKLGEDLQTEPI
jgi:hypothetical protein